MEGRNIISILLDPQRRQPRAAALNTTTSIRMPGETFIPAHSLDYSSHKYRVLVALANYTANSATRNNGDPCEHRQPAKNLASKRASERADAQSLCSQLLSQ